MEQTVRIFDSHRRLQSRSLQAAVVHVFETPIHQREGRKREE